MEGVPKIEVNFDHALVVTLREVRYFLNMRNPSINVPAVGLRVGFASTLPTWSLIYNVCILI